MEKMKNNLSEREFFETFWANSSGGFGVLNFSTKIIIPFITFHLYLSSFSLDPLIFSFIFSLPFLFHLLSSLLFSPLLSLSSLLFSSLLLSLLFHLLLPSCPVSSSLPSCLVSPLPSSLLCLSLILSPCGVVCDVVLCCESLWSWLPWCVCAVWCGTLKTPVCPSKTSPSVHSTRPRVCRHHAQMLKHMYAWCKYTETFWTYTRGRFGWTHGEEGGCHRQYCLPKNCPRRVITWPQRFMDLTHFQFEKRSRTTCSRFLQPFALPGKTVQFQQS